MMNDERQPLEFMPLPGANAQERQQAAREQWRLEMERARDADERRRQQEDWARQEQENRLAERLNVLQREQDEYRTPTAAGGFFEFLRHHWATFQAHRSVASSKPKRR